jgi:hypothetical protein
LEDSPRDAGEQVSNQNHRQILGEEQDKNAGGHRHHSDHIHRPVSVSSLCPSIKQETEDLTTGGCIVYTCLPVRRNQSLPTLGVISPKFLEEGALGEEVVDL